MSFQPLSKRSASRLETFDPKGTVFAEFTALANKHQAVNLGQGFPNLPVPEFIRAASSTAVNNTGMLHQYTRSEGHPRLVNALSKFYSDKIGRDLNPLTEIITTVGASEAISSAVMAFINPGDEVILMQPFYDSYPASIRLAGGVPVFVSLKPQGAEFSSSDWQLDMTQLEAAITEKTKMIIINNPNNPLGKVFTRDELDAIASIAIKYDLMVLADEVYETLVYSDSKAPLIKFASLPGMFERTITVGSAGKIFGVTGWKIGWIIAPSDIARSAWMVHQFVPFAISTPLQEATAIAFEQGMENGYFETTVEKYQSLRDTLFRTLQQVGFRPMLPQAGYFIVSDIGHISLKDPNQDFSRFLTENVGVTSIPVSAFYAPDDKQSAKSFIRFAFCKDEATILEAGKRLGAYQFTR